MIGRRLIILGISMLIAVNVHAADHWLLTDLGSSAETIGRGGVEGFTSAANAIFENPAGLYRVERGSISLFTTQLFDEVTYVNAALSTQTPWGAIGVAYMEASVRNIPNTGINNDLRETFFRRYEFDYKDSILKLSYQRLFAENVSIGASLVQYSKAFDGFEGTGTNLDVGALMSFDPFEFSLSFRNIIPGSNLSFNDGADENLPFQTVAGVRYALDANDIGQFDILGQVKNTGDFLLASGGVSYQPAHLAFFRLNGGLKQFLVLEDVRDTFSFGFELMFDAIHFQYAYEKSEHFEFDNNNYFSLSLAF